MRIKVMAALGLLLMLVQAAPSARAPVWLAMDVDGDGRADRVAITHDGGGYWADLWRGGALISTSRLVASAARIPIEVAPIDVNGDGRMDLVARWRAGGVVFTQVWLSDGDGFAPSAIEPAAARLVAR